MLQTILLLALLALVMIFGIWMTFFGRRMPRLCFTLFGLCLGTLGVVFVADQFGLALDSTPMLIAMGAAALLFGLLGGFVSLVGSALGGLAVGYVYGVGLMFMMDTLLDGAIAPLIYTGASLLLILVFTIFFLIKHVAAKWLSTALIGGYMISLSAVMLITWFLYGGMNSVEIVGNAFAQLTKLYERISPTMNMLAVGGGLLVGVIGAFVQSRGLEHDRYDELDELLSNDYDPLYHDDGLFNEDAPSLLDADDAMDEPAPRRASKRRRERQQREEEQEDFWNEPEPEAPTPPPVRREPAQAPALTQPEAVPTPMPRPDQTQVFRRIETTPAAEPVAPPAPQAAHRVAPPAPSPVAQAPAREEAPPPTAPKPAFSPAQWQEIANQVPPPAAPLGDRPRFEPRASRRR